MGLEMRVFRTAQIKNFILLCTCLSFLKLLKCIRKFVVSRRTLILVGASFLYFFFIFFIVEEVVPRGKNKNSRSRGFNAHESDEDLLDATDSLNAHDADFSFAAPKPNVVYITLKAKRHKPAMIRGTVRTKSRKKIIRKNKHRNQSALNAENKVVEREWGLRAVSKNDTQITPDVNIHYVLKDRKLQAGSDAPYFSSIRIYSERAPPWFSKKDIEALRFLADCKITGIKDVSSTGNGRLLLFESMTDAALKLADKSGRAHDNSICRGRCGLIKRHVDMSEVFAFHLDRILGLNRSVPAVCRKFNFFKDGHPTPAVLWDSSLVHTDSELHSSIRLTWGSYQRSLKQRCGLRAITPKGNSGCSSIHHYEWSKLALFDFLLQIYDRLDRNCCGFKPRREDTCVTLGRHQECSDQEGVGLVHIIHRKHDPRRLVFINNKGYFDRDEGNLNFKLLEGIKQLPERAVNLLKSQRLRERLLQSLFLDQLYWESQGGRRGIEKLIDVIEGRGRILLTYITAHGIDAVPMND